MNPARWFLALACSFVTLTSVAEAVKDREGAVRNDRSARENDARWIYNDYKKGFEEAKRSGKPLMVVLRCVPCLACAGIDAAVLMDQGELDPLLKQFVCVRVINANALDMELFQFDFDLSFSTLFFNADGTIYGRYGSWQHQHNSKDATTAGLRSTLEEALKLHRGYPANKASLAGKQARPTPFKTPIELPRLMGKYGLELNWNGKVVPSCVHCHQIGDAFRLWYRDQKQPIPESWTHPYPAPETLGFSLAPAPIGKVSAVSPNSAASKAGLQLGDEILSIEGQPVMSQADVSWVLHGAPSTGGLKMQVRRTPSTATLHLELTQNWREASDISKRVGTWGMRGMALGGLVLEDLNDADRAALGIDLSSLALRVNYVGEYGTHAAAKKSGFLKNDIVLQLGAEAGRKSEGAMILHLLRQHQAGETVSATVLRGKEKLQLNLPQQ